MKLKVEKLKAYRKKTEIEGTRKKYYRQLLLLRYFVSNVSQGNVLLIHAISIRRKENWYIYTFKDRSEKEYLMSHYHYNQKKKNTKGMKQWENEIFYYYSQCSFLNIVNVKRWMLIHWIYVRNWTSNKTRQWNFNENNLEIYSLYTIHICKLMKRTCYALTFELLLQ